MKEENQEAHAFLSLSTRIKNAKIIMVRSFQPNHSTRWQLQDTEIPVAQSSDLFVVTCVMSMSQTSTDQVASTDRPPTFWTCVCFVLVHQLLVSFSQLIQLVGDFNLTLKSHLLHQCKMTYTLLNGNVVLLSLLNNTTAGLNFDLRWKSI